MINRHPIISSHLFAFGHLFAVEKCSIGGGILDDHAFSLHPLHQDTMQVGHHRIVGDRQISSCKRESNLHLSSPQKSIQFASHFFKGKKFANANYSILGSPLPRPIVNWSPTIGTMSTSSSSLWSTLISCPHGDSRSSRDDIFLRTLTHTC